MAEGSADNTNNADARPSGDSGNASANTGSPPPVSSYHADLVMNLARMGTLLFSVLFFFSGSSTWYSRALLAYGVASALKLHIRARESGVRLNINGFKRLLMEDTAHYILYVLIFALAGQPITLTLVPVFLFALLHSTAYIRTTLGNSGSAISGYARQLATTIESKTRLLLTLIALNEILIFPLTVLLIFIGHGSFITPFIYYRFLSFRYCSLRNPYNRTVFRDMRLHGQNYAASPNCPQFLRSIITNSIMFVSRFHPAAAPTNYVDL